MSYIRNDLMLDLVTDKRIAVVGPSAHLLDTDLGSYLDDYDLICRLNCEVYPKGYEKDYGSRTDIISYAGDTRYIKNFAYNLKVNEDVVKDVQLVFLSCIKAQHDWGGSVVENFNLAAGEYDLPYDYIGPKNYYLGLSEFGVEPNSGQMTIWMFLQYPIKELFITGMSFYQQFADTRNNRDSFYDVDQIYSVIPLHSTHDPHLGHPQGPQQEKFAKLLSVHQDKVKIDSYLNTLLNLNYPNVKDLND